MFQGCLAEGSCRMASADTNQLSSMYFSSSSELAWVCLHTGVGYSSKVRATALSKLSRFYDLETN